MRYLTMGEVLELHRRIIHQSGEKLFNWLKSHTRQI